MRVLLLSFLALYSFVLKAQNPISVPQIENYSSVDYRAGSQNWNIDQDKNGVMYFGNNEGLLTFDGRYWKLYPLPNKTVVRSVKIDVLGRIFVGGQNEIGYFFPDDQGMLQYHSLKDLIPVQDRQFPDIWNIVIDKGSVFFRSTTKIFQFKDKAIRVYKPEMEWTFLGIGKGKIFAQERTKGLMVLRSGHWEILNASPAIVNTEITSILEYKGDTLLVTTLKHGVFLLHGNSIIKKTTSEDPAFYNDRIYCAVKVNKDWYALGTTSAGLFIMDRQGKIQQKFSYTEGVQKNNIRSVFIDKNQNLWLGLDDGIDFIAINSAIKHIYPDKNKQATGYAVQIFNNMLYIGTSNGLFSIPVNTKAKDLSYSKGTFSKVKNTEGQVWHLQEINKKLLMAHEDGSSEIIGNTSKKIYSSPGTWLFQPLSAIFPSSNVIAGTYRGLKMLEFSADNFIDKGYIGTNVESLRFLCWDGNTKTVWASHPYLGIFKFQLSDDLKTVKKSTLYGKKDGLPSNLYNYVFYIKNRIVIASEKGIYEYNPVKNKFSPSAFLQPVFKDMRIEYMNEDDEGHIWFASSKKAGVVDFSKPSGKENFSIVYFPELNSKVVGGFESIYPYNSENIFIGAGKGVFHVNYKKYTQNIKQLNVLLGEVKLTGKKDSIIFGGYFNQPDISRKTKIKAELPHQLNSLHFEFSSTLFEQLNNIQFSYKLDGFDKEWLPWTDKSEKDYTNLPPGEYTFLVKARNNLGSESAPISYSFKVLPAWYQSYWTYFAYVLLAAGAVYLILRWQQNKHQKEQERLKYLHQLELEHNEKEIIKLKNEKLEADVNFKNKELATTTMHLVQRGKVLAKIKDELAELGKSHNIQDNSPDIKRVMRLLNEVERNDADWDQFAIHFDHVHSNFLTILKEKFPDLTPNELKLCAYLKMNLSSKEMAQLMSITIRAVEVSRYRLRKKLKIASDVNLFDFLMQAVSA